MITKRNRLRLKIRDAIREEIEKSETQHMDRINKTVTVMRDINNALLVFYSNYDKAREEFKKNFQKQTVQLLFVRSISQIESVLVLIEYGKYMEAYSILRNLMETVILKKYFIEFPFESRRWLDFLNNQSGEDKGYKSLDTLKKFNDYLSKNEYSELISLIDKNNFRKYRDFKPEIVRKRVFKNRQEIHESLSRLYSELSGKYVHVSLSQLNMNNKLTVELFRDIVLITSYFCKNSGDIFIEFFQSELPQELINDFCHLKLNFATSV